MQEASRSCRDLTSSLEKSAVQTKEHRGLRCPSAPLVWLPQHSRRPAVIRPMIVIASEGKRHACRFSRKCWRSRTRCGRAEARLCRNSYGFVGGGTGGGRESFAVSASTPPQNSHRPAIAETANDSRPPLSLNRASRAAGRALRRASDMRCRAPRGAAVALATEWRAPDHSRRRRARWPDRRRPWPCIRPARLD